MLKTVLTAVAVLATVTSAAAQWGASSERTPAVRLEASAQPPRAGSPSVERTRDVSEAAISPGQIARLKAALKLRPEQQSHWAPVEAALSDLARDRSAAVADITTKLRRLKALAAPLIRSLDDIQKSDAVAFARRIGYGQLAASF